MREIKFRALMLSPGVHEGKWAYLQGVGSRIWSSKNGTYYGEVDYSTLSQFVGIKDMKGSDIYEGDILRKDTKNWEGKKNPPLIYVVSYYVDGFRTTLVTKKIKKNYLNQEIIPVPSKMAFKDWTSCEVIGSIHTHPELINQRCIGSG